MIFFKKIRASAMQFAILVSTIIAILLGSFLVLTHTHRLFKTQTNLLLFAVEEATNGIEYSLHPQNKFTDSITIEKKLSKTSIKKNSWGGFKKVESVATVKNKSFTKIALIGAALSKPNTSIVVADNKFPLVLVGNTVLEGDAYVSDKGIKAGVISGHYFNGKTLVKGSVSAHTGGLPKLEPQWIENTQKLLDQTPSLDKLMTPSENISKNSFFKQPQFIYNREQITLAETYIGNIIIKSDVEVVITQHAMLTDVTIVAPKITIENGFRGSASFIAKQRIKIEENVTLWYPSALVVLDEKASDASLIPLGEEPISISENTTINGIIIYLNTTGSSKEVLNTTKTNIAIAPQAVVKGAIYCDGNIELQGAVNGSVYTQRFITRAYGSVYMNHIYNGIVLGNDIHPKYSGLPLLGKKKGIVKWLY